MSAHAHRAGATLAGLILSALLLGAPAPALAQAGAALPSLAEPGISPDGSEIAFVSGGDIWTVPSTGGAARLLVAHSADESRPLYSPDGRYLAFNTDRDGSVDVYLMELGTGSLRRLTHSSGSEQLDGWSRDGAWVYFSSSEEDVSGMSDVFRVRASGGTPFVVAGDRYETEFFAAPGPDGTLALSTRGRMAQGQWWRNGHSHIDEAEIWLVREGDPPVYSRLSAGGKNVWPMWSAEGDRVFFMSDRSGAENLWSVSASGGEATRLTDFDDGRVLWPTIAAGPGLIAFERDFGIWTHDIATGASRELDVRLVGSVEGPRPETRRTTDDFDGLALSPDGRKVAFLVRGDVFAAPAAGDVPAARVTDTPGAEDDLAWSPDSRSVAYASWRNGIPQLFLYDFSTGTERQLTSTEGRDASPAFSPDGRHLAYNRAGEELRVIDLESGQDRRIAGNTSGRSPFVWSPDSRWIAYGGRTDEFNNAWVVPIGGGEPRQVSFLANTNFGSLGWSATGKFLVFRTGQRTEPGRLMRVDLIPQTPTFQEDRFWELFNQERPEEERDRRAEPAAPRTGAGTPSTPPDVRVDFDGIRRRGFLVDLDLDVGAVVLSPDGEHAAVTSDGGIHYVTFEPDGGVDVRAIGRPGPGGGFGGFSSLQFSPDGRELFMVRRGQIQVMGVQSGETRTVSTSAEHVVDFDREKMAVFTQAWTEMRDGFYDPNLHGADWDRVRADFAPRVAGARTPAELSRLLNLMLGELNGSHLGHRGGGGGVDGPDTGRLGLRFDRSEYQDGGRFRVTEVIELGPAHVAGIEVGEYVLDIDGTALGSGTDLHRLLTATAGEKVTLTVSADPSGAGGRQVEVQPMSPGAERQLVYRAWVEGRRAEVDRLSGGRLGYVHIASMSEGALEQLIFDLDQENHAKEGVVVDVRNNNGGFVNVYAIDILTRRNYFTMRNRGGVVAPSRVQLGQRALLAPTVLVTNQHTLSDGEDFTEGYRTLELGAVVGEPTAGWIIYTGSVGLVDGTSIRMPRTEIRDNRGQVMERTPRPVDVEVERPAGESYLGRDSQLERAVEVLLERLERRVTSGG